MTSNNVEVHRHPWQQKIVGVAELARKADPDFQVNDYILFVSAEDTKEYDELIPTGQLGISTMHFSIVWQRYPLCMGYTVFWEAKKTEIKKFDSLTPFEQVMVGNYRRLRDKYDHLYDVSDYKKQREGYNIATKECDDMASMTMKRAIAKLEAQGVDCEETKQIMGYYL